MPRRQRYRDLLLTAVQTVRGAATAVAQADATAESSAATPRPATPPQTATSGTEADKLMLELAAKSYAEVLDATKHQDDKIGRFLTAIAFLTTGAIALIASSSGEDLRRHFVFPSGSGSAPLLAWAAGAFFTCVLGSVALLLLCLSVPIRQPSQRRDHRPENPRSDDLAGSRLFYSYIALEPDTSWERRWSKNDDADQIRRDLVSQYARETHNLAERANSKYRHTFEASSLFVLSLLFLGICVYLKILAVNAGPPEPGPGNAPTNIALPSFNLATQNLMILATIAALHSLCQVYVRFVHDQRSVQLARNARIFLSGIDTHPDANAEKVARRDWKLMDDTSRYWQRRATWTLLVMAPAYSFAAATPHAWSHRHGYLLVLVTTGLMWGSLFLMRERPLMPDQKDTGDEPQRAFGLTNFWGVGVATTEHKGTTNASGRWLTIEGQSRIVSRAKTARRAAKNRRRQLAPAAIPSIRRTVKMTFQIAEILAVPAVLVASICFGGVPQLLAILAPAVGLSVMSIARPFVTQGANLRAAKSLPLNRDYPPDR